MTLLIFMCIQFAVQVGAELPPPQDLTLITLNTNYTLSWDWHQSPADSHNVSFTTQYVGMHQLKSKKKSPKWSTVCDETSQKSCDLTALNLHYLCQYMLRVRANMNRDHSDWVLKEFWPKKDAALGPPTKVNLIPAGSTLDVFISDPGTSTNITMRSHIPTVRYHIVYWERSADTQNQTLSSNATIVTLPNLKTWTWYCVRVRSKVFDKSSSFTPSQCMQTKGNVPWWQIFMYFLGILGMGSIGLLLLYIFFRCYKTINATFYPSNQLPPHLKKYLCESSGFDVPSLFNLNPESERLCERVIVCAEPTLLEIYSPPPETLLVPLSGLGPDSSRYNRQDSSSSGDSGVYSTGGSSNLQCLKGKLSG